MLEAHFDPQVSRSADVTGATQYDSGQRLRIYGLPTPQELLDADELLSGETVSVQVQFAYKGDSQSETRLAGYDEQAGCYLCDVPNAYLTRASEVQVYVYVGYGADADGKTRSKTMYTATFRPEGRAAPSDSVTTEQLNAWDALVAEVNMAISDAVSATSRANGAAESADNAASSASSAAASANSAATSAGNAATSANSAASSASNAATSANNAASSATAAAESANSAASSAKGAAASASSAASSANSAASSANSAATNANNAANRVDTSIKNANSAATSATTAATNANNAANRLNAMNPVRSVNGFTPDANGAVDVKVSGAGNGHVAVFDSNGKLISSGKSFWAFTRATMTLSGTTLTITTLS